MGFSIIGFLIAISIFLPNLLMVRYPPKKVPPGMKDPHLVLTILERVGQTSCIIVSVLSKPCFYERPTDIWFWLMIGCIASYLLLWVRYVVNGHYFTLLVDSVGGVPIPMAFTPVLAFAFAAIWGHNAWLGVAVAFLAAGHLPISWNTHRYLH